MFELDLISFGFGAAAILALEFIMAHVLQAIHRSPKIVNGPVTNAAFPGTIIADLKAEEAKAEKFFSTMIKPSYHQSPAPQNTTIQSRVTPNLPAPLALEDITTVNTAGTVLRGESSAVVNTATTKIPNISI